LKEGEAGQTYLRQPRKCLKDLKIGSWNVLSLYNTGALKMLQQQLDSYKLDSTAIQELRWLDKGVMEKWDHVIFYSCQKKSHMFGTGFIVSKKLSTLS
jgi:exonuclease III